MTARSAEQVGYHSWLEVDPATYERRWSIRDRSRRRRSGTRLSDAGRRVGVIDVPHAARAPSSTGSRSRSGACHDRHFGLAQLPRTGSPRSWSSATGCIRCSGSTLHASATSRPTTSSRARATLGPRPRTRELAEGCSPASTRSAAVARAARPRALGPLLLRLRRTHAAGHHLWHHHDPAPPAPRPCGRGRARRPPRRHLRAPRRRQSATHLERCGPETTFVAPAQSRHELAPRRHPSARGGPAPASTSTRPTGSAGASAARSRQASVARPCPPRRDARLGDLPRRSPGERSRTASWSTGGVPTPITTGLASAGSWRPTTPSTGASGSTSGAANRAAWSSPAPSSTAACDAARPGPARAGQRRDRRAGDQARQPVPTSTTAATRSTSCPICSSTGTTPRP